MTVHNFHRSLKKSDSYIDAPWWEDVYRDYFPNLEQAVPMRQYGRAQTNGIDRRLLLSDGTIVDVDEKVREEKWPDFLLEYYSSKERQTPGWIEKDLSCHYICYYFIPSSECYLLDFKMLRKAWKQNKEEWLQKATDKDQQRYRIVEADNGVYKTESVAVPKSVVWDAMNAGAKVTWKSQSTSSRANSNRPIISQDEFLSDQTKQKR